MKIGGSPLTAPSAPLIIARARNPYMVSSNGFSWPVQRYQPGASKLFGVYEKWFVSDDYWTFDPRFAFVNSYLTPSGAGGQEAANGNDITIEAVSLQVGPDGAPVQLKLNGSTAAYTLVNDTEIWTDAPTGIRIPPGTRCCIRVARSVASAASYISGQYPGASVMFGDRVETSTGSLAAKVMAGGISTATPGTPDAYAYGPAMMVAKGWDGRPCVMGLGTSINAAAGQYRALRTHLGACSFTERGMDSRIGGAPRLPFCNWAVAGSLAAGIIGTGANQGITRRMRLVGMLLNVPFTAIDCGHGTNDVNSTLSGPQTALQNEWAALKLAWPAARVVQHTLMPRTQSTDGFVTQANQTGQTADWIWPGGAAWATYEWLAQPNNRNVDAIIDLLAACDNYAGGGQRGKWRTDITDKGWSTTLAAASAAAAGQFSLNGNPRVGTIISFPDNPESLLVTGTQNGSAPYTAFTQTAAASAHALSGTVTEKAATTDGTHPGDVLAQWVADTVIAPAKIAGVYG